MKDPLSLEAFADWCAKQPAEKYYNYIDNRGCAFAQYLGSLGIEASVGSRYWCALSDMVQKPIPFPIGALARETPRTFGALAARLRASS